MRRMNLSLISFSLLLCAVSTLKAETPKKEISFSFKENKGQVGDQFSKPRPDVLFSGNNGDFIFHLRNNGISYQLSRVDDWKQTQAVEEFKYLPGKVSSKTPGQTTVYRID